VSDEQRVAAVGDQCLKVRSRPNFRHWATWAAAEVAKTDVEDSMGIVTFAAEAVLNHPGGHDTDGGSISVSSRCPSAGSGTHG
jgi:hypothetical protein